MRYEWSDVKTREVVEQVFRPTEKRMYEIQDRFGQLCSMQVDQGNKHEKMYAKMEQALDLKGTVKTQIVDHVQSKITKPFEQKIDQQMKENDKVKRQQDQAMKRTDAQIQAWIDFQKGNETRIKETNLELKATEERIYEEFKNSLE